VFGLLFYILMICANHLKTVGKNSMQRAVCSWQYAVGSEKREANAKAFQLFFRLQF